MFYLPEARITGSDYIQVWRHDLKKQFQKVSDTTGQDT